LSPLTVDKVIKRFRQGDRDVVALNSITLDVTQGHFLAIMGASGSGKSTLLHLMAGLTLPDSGSVKIRGQELSSMNDHELTLFRRRHIGLVFQAFNLIPTLSAEENIALPLMLDNINGDTAAQKVRQLAATLGLQNRIHHRPDALSGGEQQRVAIGRALAADPDLLLADEPTGNLDSISSKAVCELLRDLCLIHGKTIVMVTHEPSVAAYAQEVAVLRDGELVERFQTDGATGQDLAARYQESLK
jgi:putative ABC transport system ATP-binding protein